MTENPYAPPASVSSAEPLSADEATRQRFLKHETSVKSIGTFFLLGALVVMLFAPLYLVGGIIGLVWRGGGEGAAISVVVGCLLLFVGFVQVATAIGLRRLEPWSRTIATILSVFGLLGIPVGTLISIYCLYLLLSQKGGVVFSEDYRRVVAGTPHIRYKTPIVAVLLLVLLAAMLLGGFATLLIR